MLLLLLLFVSAMGQCWDQDELLGDSRVQYPWKQFGAVYGQEEGPGGSCGAHHGVTKITKCKNNLVCFDGKCRKQSDILRPGDLCENGQCSGCSGDPFKACGGIPIDPPHQIYLRDKGETCDDTPYQSGRFIVHTKCKDGLVCDGICKIDQPEIVVSSKGHSCNVNDIDGRLMVCSDDMICHHGACHTLENVEENCISGSHEFKICKGDTFCDTKTNTCKSSEKIIYRNLVISFSVCNAFLMAFMVYKRNLIYENINL